jgi:hypothetical protein
MLYSHLLAHRPQLSFQDHTSMDKESHYMEVVQKTRNRLESGELTNEEIDRSVVVSSSFNSADTINR